jgi:adenylyltransferase/sulfurtransferase
VPGQIGLLQATEAIKLILGKGTPLIGQFLIYDSLKTDFRVFRVEKNPSCPLCNQKPLIKELSDYHDVSRRDSLSGSVA